MNLQIQKTFQQEIMQIKLNNFQQHEIVIQDYLKYDIFPKIKKKIKQLLSFTEDDKQLFQSIQFEQELTLSKLFQFNPSLSLSIFLSECDEISNIINFIKYYCNWQMIYVIIIKKCWTNCFYFVDEIRHFYHKNSVIKNLIDEFIKKDEIDKKFQILMTFDQPIYNSLNELQIDCINLLQNKKKKKNIIRNDFQYFPNYLFEYQRQNKK
ncbi:hypothetical protein TTHERM_000874719 (macronuclear) [Tetrahymena thermophila SB210]|uniref:Uncharacterized protein n=1 Tax=Tetrahymena thermophila (strain SB210) TaxID=312017 RepID=W7XBF9_TETTS|nr:hypothetical protein TTHERM_000874719 [Tetrahymena thermophila SB210]EWS76720.1 hypothetical protein TTHERM_000874719 [Tetrahymena thermophila SB210]|eukprot:XP_012650752.1 hypothetical protein TTHERM_000874719 [Tetrahymena thermophila SB210]